jgi:hypothetical protein
MHKATRCAEDRSATVIRCIILHTFFGIDNGLRPQDRGEMHRGCGSRVQHCKTLGHASAARFFIWVWEEASCRARDAGRRRNVQVPVGVVVPCRALLSFLAAWSAGIELRPAGSLAQRDGWQRECRQAVRSKCRSGHSVRRRSFFPAQLKAL